MLVFFFFLRICFLNLFSVYLAHILFFNCTFIKYRLFVYFIRLAETKKEMGNQQYKIKQYGKALGYYTEAIGEFVQCYDYLYTYECLIVNKRKVLQKASLS